VHFAAHESMNDAGLLLYDVWPHKDDTEKPQPTQKSRRHKKKANKRSKEKPKHRR